MPAKARRRAVRLRGWLARRALPVLCLLPAAAAAAEVITGAHYAGPTDRYPHAVLGDPLEYETLVLRLSTGRERRFTLPAASVFEDTSPRLADLDGDGAPEVLVVESDQRQGARLAVFGAEGRIASTPYIGTRFRWLAPLGAADLDGDGYIEVAYVDRPHLAKTLRIWRFSAGDLVEVADFAGVTNHRIGERDIAGGVRHCRGSPEMVLADASWSNLMALRFDGAAVSAEPLSQDTSRESFAAAMACTASD